jgi:nicotinamidase/pyrazinamidase
MAGTPTAVEAAEAGLTLLIIDPQNDFHPGGSLAIPTADSDAERIATFIRRHVHEIDRIVITLDSHHRTHIAHGLFWVSESGARPAPFTPITSDDVARGKWRAADASKQTAAEAYVRSLEERGRFKLCIWPEHCLIGSHGHAVRPAILAAVDEWAEARMREVTFVWKGQNCLTEMYSALRAEVPVPSDERTLLNEGLLRSLKKERRVLVCGQALSHCVNFTVRDLVASYEADAGADGIGEAADGADRLASIGILRDGTSVVPGFEDAGATFLADMEAKGVRILTTDSFFDKWEF